MSERFYINSPLHPGPITLDGPEAHHLATVCRLRPGHEVCLFNGDGCEYPARITSAARRAVSLDILDVHRPQRELPFTLEAAVPLPKGDRSQFLVEKLTELGVTALIPLTTHYSTLHPRDYKHEKLQRYVIEASKQCGRNVLMHIGQPTSWTDYVASGTPGEIRILAHPHQAEDLASLGKDAKQSRIIRITVGPEGGFTDEELALADAHGWRKVNLGPRILRVETAAIVLAAYAIGKAAIEA